MAKDRLEYIQMGFRAEMGVHEKIKSAALRQGRSMNNLLTILIKEQVDYYEKEGWDNFDPNRWR